MGKYQHNRVSAYQVTVFMVLLAVSLFSLLYSYAKDIETARVTYSSGVEVTSGF